MFDIIDARCNHVVYVEKILVWLKPSKKSGTVINS